MSFTASQTVLHLAENAAYVRITQCYDSTPKLLKNGAVQAGGLAERIAILYMKLLHADASMWFRSLSADKVMSYFRKKADRVTAAEYVHVYGEVMKNTVEFERVTDIRQSCSFFEKFVPTMVCVTSWTIVQGTSQESRSSSVPLEIAFSVGSDFISDIIPTLSIVPPQLVFANQVAKADAPYIRMARDPVALILEKVTYGTKGVENKLYEDTGLTYAASMEMRTADKYHLGQKILGNQELKYASLGCNVFGLDSEDRIDRKIVYTDGAQTSQPVYDSLFYNDNGLGAQPTIGGSGNPIRQHLPIPLMSTFANDKQSIQTIFIGAAIQMSLNVNLRNLDQLFVLEGRGKSFDPLQGITVEYRQPLVPTVNMAMSYRYGLLPPYLQVILASSSSINVYTNNRLNSAPLAAGKVNFATKTPVAYLATFGLLNRTGLSKLLPVERAERWSQMTASKKRQVLGPKITKVLPLLDVKSVWVEDTGILITGAGTVAVNYTGPTIQVGTKMQLKLKDGTPYSSFTLGAEITNNVFSIAPNQATPPAAGFTANLLLASLSTSVVPPEILATGTVSPELDLFYEVEVQTKVTVHEEQDILKNQAIEYSGAAVRIVEAVDNRTLAARSLNTKSHSAPHRRGMYVHSFCTEQVGPNRESGYILPVVGTDAAFIYEPSDFIDQAGIVADYDVYVVVGSRNVVQSKAGMIHPKFIG